MNQFLLDEMINELKEIEPYWNCCFPCKNQGKCCVDAKISIYQSEWKPIVDYVINLPEKEKNELSTNIKSKKQCVFRSEEKCLIHDVRPINCKFTPFQYKVTTDNYLEYSMISNDCTYRFVREKLEENEATRLKQCKFAQLRNFDTQSWYLSLNYLAANQGINSYEPSSCALDRVNSDNLLDLMR